MSSVGNRIEAEFSGFIVRRRIANPPRMVYIKEFIDERGPVCHGPPGKGVRRQRAFAL